ncbi:hypothetical protein Q7P37_005762 [Cladosporium fusiforme]
MPAGGCTCGKIRISYDTEPSAKKKAGHSHCSRHYGFLTISPRPSATVATARKSPAPPTAPTSSSPTRGFQVTSGTPKTWTKKAESGADVTTSFCGDCGTNLWRETATFGENRVLKVGVLDELSALNELKPAVELFVPERVSWLAPQEGAAQFKGMPGSEQVA